FVIPVPKKNVALYRKIARKPGKIWMEHGALQYVECVGDDLDQGKLLTPFPRAARTKPGETVIFSFIVYRSRAHRDRVDARVMKAPRLAKLGALGTPFESKRMVYGGFRTLVDL